MVDRNHAQRGETKWLGRKHQYGGVELMHKDNLGGLRSNIYLLSTDFRRLHLLPLQG